jgi:hypothetical protein
LFASREDIAMSVDFTKPAHILAVHGVQTGTDDDIDSQQKIEKLTNNALARSHIERDFESIGFYYEDINNKAQKFYQLLAKAITSGKPLVGAALKQIIDLAGDVVTASANTSTAKKIRRKLAKKILESYDSGNKLIIVAHSLGTVYALDTICELINTDGLFNGDDRASWPVQGLVTMGSPLGLDLDILGQVIFAKRSIATINAQYQVLPWHNFFNRLDPVVSGNVFGSPVKISGSRGPVERRYGTDTSHSQWMLRGHAVTSGKQWLLAHTAYWNNPRIGDRLVDMLWG